MASGRWRTVAASVSPELLLVALLWGAVFAAGKVAVRDAPPLTVGLLRFGVASLALLPFWLRGRRNRPHERLDWTTWRAVLLLALTAVAGYNALFFIGLRHAPSSDAILLTPTTNPIWTALLAALILRERINERLAIGMAIAVAGMLLVLVGGVTGNYDGGRLLGDVLFVVAAIVFGLSHVIGRIATRRLTPLGATTLAGLTGSAMLLPFALAEGGFDDLARAGISFWLAVLFISLAGTALAYVLWYRSVSRIGAGRTSFYTNLVPVFGLTISALMLGEYPTVLQIVGGALMLAAVIWGTQQPAAAALNAAAVET